MSVSTLKLQLEDQLKRISVDTKNVLRFQDLVQIAYNLFPEIHGDIEFVYTDDEGDTIKVSSDGELQEAVQIMKSTSKGYLRFTVRPKNGAPTGHSIHLEYIHTGVTCDECRVHPIRGPRFKCTVRPNFDLCEKCEQKKAQPYPMVKVYDPESPIPHPVYRVIEHLGGRRGGFPGRGGCGPFGGRGFGGCGRGRRRAQEQQQQEQQPPASNGANPCPFAQGNPFAELNESNISEFLTELQQNYEPLKNMDVNDIAKRADALFSALGATFVGASFEEGKPSASAPPAAGATASACGSTCASSAASVQTHMTEEEQITAAVLASLSMSQSSTDTSSSHSSVRSEPRPVYSEDIVIESKEDEIVKVTRVNSGASAPSTVKEVEPIISSTLTMEVEKLDLSRETSSNHSFDFCEESASALMNIGEYTAQQPASSAQPSTPVVTIVPPSAQLIDHVTFPDGARVAPNTTFLKTWRLRNNGTSSWPIGCLVINAKKGDNMTNGSVAKSVPSVAGGDKVEISLELVAPSLPGRYVAYYQLVDPNGEVFCSNIWCEIVVTEPSPPIMNVAAAANVPAPVDLPPAPARITIPATTSVVPTGIRTAQQPIDPLAADMQLWGQELESLNNMGFTNVHEVLPLLKHYIKNPCMKTGLLDTRGLERVLDALFHNTRV